MTELGRQTVLVWFALGALALLSLALSLGRIYQVDEAQNLYMARVAVNGEASTFFTTAALDLLPLGWITRPFGSSAAMFTCARLVFLPLFWLNIVLLAVATEIRLASAAGAWVLLGAATLAPLWDHGFEIRHDNVLLSGILGMWILGRPSTRYRPWRLACTGALTVVLQCIAVKAFLYTLPVSFLTLVMPSQTAEASRVRRAAAWLVGFLIGLASVRTLYAATGLWDTHLRSYRGLAIGLERAEKVAPQIQHSFSLERLCVASPLLVVATLAALVIMANGLRRVRWSTQAWQLGLAEALLFLVAFVAFMANPTPFPYNLVLLVPFAYLLVVRVARASVGSLPEHRALRAWVLALVALTHMLPFARATVRHLSWDNARQRQLMTTAEALTDVLHDRVYDATGMVVTRLATQHLWYLHSLNMSGYGSHEYPVLAEVLQERPAAVIIRSYRTDWLPASDSNFIAAHYVPLADDFWVLGAVIRSERSWNCLLGGRYALELSADQHTARTAVLIDGKPVSPGVQSLAAGRYQLEVRGAGQAVLVWLGPRLRAVPYLPQGDHERLFVNWY